MRVHDISKPKKEKLVKWYGWIIIFLLCMTPLVIIILPKLMLNVGRINRMLKDSRIPVEHSLTGEIVDLAWDKNIDGDLISIECQMLIKVDQEGDIKASFRKFVGKGYQTDMLISESDHVEVAGTYKENIFFISSIRNLNSKNVYDSEPLVSVY